MVAKDNVLITITTAANMGGIEQAKAGILGLGVATGGLTLLTAGAVMAGKSMVEIAMKQEEAHKSLAQAVDFHNSQVGKTSVTTKDVTKEIRAHEVALRALEKVELGMPAHHKATALQLFNLSEAQAQVAKTAAALAEAEKPAANTIDQTKTSVAEADAYLRKFIATNRSYVSSQSEVEEGYGALLRSGVPVAEAQKDMNRAVDLAAIKGISLAEAVSLIQKAEEGRLRGLIDLGISTGKYTDAEGNLINKSKDVAEAMAEVDAKTKGGRDTLTQTQQMSNRLSMDWQDLATKGGPPLVDMLDQILRGADAALTALEKIGSDPHGFDGLNQALVGASKWIHDYLIQPAQDAWNWLYRLENQGATPPALNEPNYFAPGTAPVGAKASGGPVMPGGTYVVGERGPETLHVGGQGGYITPNGAGGSHIHVHLDGIYAGDGPSLDILANKIALRLGYATGR